MRYAFSMLGDEKRIKLQELLLPTLEELSTEMWFGHWPNNYKEGVKKEFFHNYTVTEFEYSKFTKLVPDKDESPKDTLLWEFGKNIAKYSGHEYDMAVAALCNVVTVDKLEEIRLDNLVSLIGKEI